MGEKKITRKVISKAVTAKKEAEVKATEEKQIEAVKDERTKKACFFCQSKTVPSYTDIAVLRRFVTDRAKIVAKAKSNLCSRHQRVVTRNIKYARHLSILPFTPSV